MSSESEILTIENQSEDKNMTCEIYDITGKLLLTITIRESLNKVDLDTYYNNFKSGIYFIKLTGVSESVKKKLVIK